MPALSRPLFGCALLCAVPAVACSTQEVRPDPKDVMLVGIASAEYDSAAAIFVIRDDAIAQDASLTPRNLPPYSVMVDGDSRPGTRRRSYRRVPARRWASRCRPAHT